LRLLHSRAGGKPQPQVLRSALLSLRFIARIKLEVLDLEVLMAFTDEHEADASA
jgi:hypothetical protein